VVSIHPQPWMRISQAAFEKAASDLKAEIPHLDDGQAAVRLMQLVARLGDGHTTLFPFGHDAFTEWYPLRIDRFADGFYVTAAATAWKGLLAARILRMGACSAQEAYENVGSVAAVDSRLAWPRSVTPLLTSACILEALGIIDSDTLSLDIETPGGEHRRISVLPVPWRFTLAWNARGAYQAPGGEAFVNVYDLLETLPLHLRRVRDEAYWFEHLADARALYVQFNAVTDTPTETLAQFTDRMWRFYDQHGDNIDRLVLDLRYNGGGNGYLLRPFIHGFIRHDDINQRGRLFAIVGPGTFSAASNCLGQMIEHTEVIVVGEATSGPLNWCSDTQGFRLPHSGLYMSVSTLCWQTGHPSDDRGYYAPDYPVPVEAADFFAGRDRALEAILSGHVRSLEDILTVEGADAFRAEYERRALEMAGQDGWFPFLEFDLRRLGFQMQSSNRMEEALAAFELNAVRYPTSWRCWNNLGAVHQAMGSREQAIRCYEKSLELDPGNDPASRSLRGLRLQDLWIAQGKDRAHAYYHRARAREPNAFNEDELNDIGYSLLQAGESTTAIEVFRLNAASHPRSGNVWDSLAEAYMEHGDTEQAILYYQKSLEIDPENENARIMLQRLHGTH